MTGSEECNRPDLLISWPCSEFVILTNFCNVNGSLALLCCCLLPALKITLPFQDNMDQVSS